MQTLYSYRNIKCPMVKIRNIVTVKARECAPITAEKAICVTPLKPAIKYENGRNYKLFIILFLLLCYEKGS